MTATQLLVTYAAATGVAAFVFSLPFGRTRVGSFLRRIAGVCAAVALLPAIITAVVAIVKNDVGGGADAFECNLGLILGAAVLSLLAWAILAIRARIRGVGRSPRTPMLRRYRHRADNDLLDFLERFNRDDRDA